MKRKIQKKFTYKRFGFPVILMNVPMVQICGVWAPHINLNSLAKVVLQLLCYQQSPLTGAQIRFIRESTKLQSGQENSKSGKVSVGSTTIKIGKIT